MKRYLFYTLFLFLFLWVTVYFGNDLLRTFESNEPSNSIGSTSNGQLENGKRLPSSGENYVTYSRLGSLIGRTAVHNKVRETILDAYDRLEEVNPGVTYVFGETGWPNGGRFRPHKTHRNGLSVDFMVPIITENNESITFPTDIWNKFGYSIEFDSNGSIENYKIDFESIAKHLYQLHLAAAENGTRIGRVIFDLKFQPDLFATKTGKKIRSLMSFSTKRSWVRHDEHYHVDFIIQ